MSNSEHLSEDASISENSSIEADFASLFERLRNGDASAAESLVRTYEPEVRRFVRFRLTTPELRRFLDSMDISQSVFSRFFVEFNEGRIDVESPAQLRGLLMCMTRNRLLDVVRRERAIKRDVRRLDGDAHAATTRLVSGERSVSSLICARETLQAVLAELSPEEKRLAEARLAGRSWKELAEELQTGGDALRKRLERAFDRVAKALGVVS